MGAQRHKANTNVHLSIQKGQTHGPVQSPLGGIQNVPAPIWGREGDYSGMAYSSLHSRKRERRSASRDELYSPFPSRSRSPAGSSISISHSLSSRLQHRLSLNQSNYQQQNRPQTHLPVCRTSLSAFVLNIPLP